MKLNSKHFICDCNSFEHQTIFWYDYEDNLLYIEIHLITYRNFFKRLWVGLKYIFGYKSRYGNWDSFIFKEEDEKKLYEFLKKSQNKTKISYYNQPTTK